MTDGPSPSTPARTVEFVLRGVCDTESLGRQLARLCKPGDFIVLSGDLGAGKTTLTRGLGEELGVRGPVTSPTFVVARRHPNLGTGPDLVHVDAYRIGSQAEIDDVDLLERSDTAITVVEWGAGRVEHLAESRVLVELAADVADDDTRHAVVHLLGPRWSGADLAVLASFARQM